VLGEWNRLSDINTLVDVGTDGSIVDAIANIWTGVGKKPVERVVFTHSHFDHAGGLPRIRAAYQPEVFAYTMIEGVQRQLRDGERLLMGDEQFEVLYMPEHSCDSICFYSAESGTLFSGDTPISVNSPGGTYNEHFVGLLEELLRRGVTTIYSGHDQPIIGNVHTIIHRTIENLRPRNIH
jgi:glyoxylase-like metal-dependent hydrolase (beta-lactamase superfamily II)